MFSLCLLFISCVSHTHPFNQCKPPVMSCVVTLTVCLSVSFFFFSVFSPRTRFFLPVLNTWHPYRCWDVGACHFRLCGRLLHTVRTREREKGEQKIDLEEITGNGKKGGRGGGRGLRTKNTHDPNFIVCTTLFFCLYKSYLINCEFALRYPHQFFFPVRGGSDTK